MNQITVTVPDKMECPACKKNDAEVFQVAMTLHPCPYCGLSGEAGADIRAIHIGGPALKAQAIAQRIRLDQVERELRSCKVTLILIRDQIAELSTVIGTPEG